MPCRNSRPAAVARWDHRPQPKAGEMGSYFESAYRKLVCFPWRAEFSANYSLFVCPPTMADAFRFSQILAQHESFGDQNRSGSKLKPMMDSFRPPDRERASEKTPTPDNLPIPLFCLLTARPCLSRRISGRLARDVAKHLKVEKYNSLFGVDHNGVSDTTPRSNAKFEKKSWRG